MTVQANLPPTNTNSDGVTTTFNYGFKVTREEHLKAMYTVIATGETGDLEIDSVTGVGNDGGGTVTFATAPADGMIVTIDSIAPLSQIEAFTGNKLPPATVERMGDAIAIQNQRQQSQIERSVRFPASDDQIPTLPAKAQRADKILGFSADGSDFAMVEGAAASQAYVDLAEAQADRAVAAATYPYTSGEQKTGAFMPGAGESLTLFTYNNASDATVTLPALAGLAGSYNIGICRTTGSGDLTISADDGALINGASSIVLASDYLCLDLTINEAGDEWVAVDKALIGLPVGTSAGDVVALDSSGRLPAVSGALLTSLPPDHTARGMAIVGIINDDLGEGIYGDVVSYSFATDSLAVSDGAAYDPVTDSYSPASEDVVGTFGVSQTTTENITATFPYFGVKFTATSNGTVDSVKVQVTGVSSGDTVNFRLYSDDAGSPGTQIGSDSDDLVIGSTGEKTATFSSGDADISSGTDYWVVFVPQTPGSISIAISVCGNQAGYGSGRANSIAGISDGSNTSVEYRMEITQASPGSMTLRPDPVTLDNADPSDVSLYVELAASGGADISSDIQCKFSIDGGSTWTTADVPDATYTFGTDNLVRFDAAFGVLTGSSFVWEITTTEGADIAVSAPKVVPLNLD
tara:strand:- start:4670 stop:6574 length:1905 start_codon:yes stop_codon:yes gene_type:complete